MTVDVHDVGMSTAPAKSVEKRNTVCTALGRSLKRIRIAAKVSQQDLANSAEVDRTYVSEIERGMGNPSVLTLANLCFALEITLADLFAEVDVALAPGGNSQRRANASQPKPKLPAKSLLR